jgi:hypothetical protein
LNLRDETISEILGIFKDAIPKWKGAIGNSFLSESQKKSFLHLLENRRRIMEL